MIVAALALLAAGAAGQEPDLDCANALTQSDMNACAYQEFKRADAALNAQWTITTAQMKERDRDTLRPEDTRPGYFDTLLAGQRAWLTYREKHCASEGYLMRGGSAEPLLISGCQTQLTDARTAQLKSLIEEY